MNALEIANKLTAPIGTSGQSTYAMCEQAVILLRRQHEAIVKLRGAIEESQSLAMWKHTGCGIRSKLERALKDTEDLK